ncbi:MAG: hypothetical protein KAW49_01785, partial [Anaerolineae bacterium]|nr:hypothetical protein [Anaerolineae bacterium]
MSFDVWRSWVRLTFLQPEIWEYFLLALYVLTVFLLLVRSRRDFGRLGWRRLPLFLGLLAASLLVNNLLVLSFSLPRLLPPPNVPTEPASPFVPLLGALPVIVAGAWLGAGPALLVGLVGGILRVGMTVGGITDPFHFAFFGFLVGFFLRQDYRDRPSLVARQPVIAGPLATFFASPLLLLSVFAHTADSGLAGLDYAVTLTQANLGLALLESLVAALVIQGVYLVSPRLRPVHVARQPPPYSRTLGRRLLFLFVPLILAMTAVLVYAVTATTLRVATLEVVDEMARDANSAVEGIPYFIQTGLGLLAEFANNEILWHGDPSTLEVHLR